MLEEHLAQGAVGTGRRRIHHRKSASDTVAFTASTLFNELPAPTPQPLAALVPFSGQAARSSADAATGSPPGGGLGAGFGPEDLLEVLKDVYEDELEFHVDELCDTEVMDVIGGSDGEQGPAPPALGPGQGPAGAGAPTRQLSVDTVGRSVPATGAAGAAAGAGARRAKSSTVGVAGGGGGSRRGCSASSAFAAAAAAAPVSARHTRNPSDPLAWSQKPSNPLALPLDKPLSEFVGQTRGNALDPAQLDPKRARRIIANRQSAHRSRMKKLAVIHDLEQQIATARSAADAVRQQVAAAAAARREQLLAAAGAHWRLEGLRREVAAEAEVQAALILELQCLGVAAQAPVQTLAQIPGLAAAAAGGSGAAGVLMTEMSPGGGCTALAAAAQPTLGPSALLPLGRAPSSAAGPVAGASGAGGGVADHGRASSRGAVGPAAQPAVGLPAPGLIPGAGAPVAGTVMPEPTLALTPALEGGNCASLLGLPAGTLGSGFGWQEPQPQPPQSQLQLSAPGGGVHVPPLLQAPTPSGGDAAPRDAAQAGPSSWPQSRAPAATSGCTAAAGSDPTAAASATDPTHPGVSANPAPHIFANQKSAHPMLAQADAADVRRQGPQSWLSTGHPATQPPQLQQQPQLGGPQLQQLQQQLRPHHRRHFSAGCAVEQRSMRGLGLGMGFVHDGGLQGATAPIMAAAAFGGGGGGGGICSLGMAMAAATTGTAAATVDTEMSAAAATAAPAEVPGAQAQQLRVRLTSASAHLLPAFVAAEGAAAVVAAESDVAPRVGYSPGSGQPVLSGAAAAAALRGDAGSGAGADAGGGGGSPMALDAAEALMADVEDFLLKD